MRPRHVASSGLPSLIMPCPTCGGRMPIKAVEPTKFEADWQDVTHACASCGTELIRTVRRHRYEAA